MNKLYATWHLGDAGVYEHLSLAQGQLIGRAGLEGALALVEAALLELATVSLPDDPPDAPGRRPEVCPGTLEHVAAPVGDWFGR
ncbi:MAG: hypothetical protein ACRDYV_02945 [Acidimicrobiia bacterium]